MAAKQILEIKVGRDMGGCYLSLRSEIAWTAITQNPTDANATFLIAGVACHNLITASLPTSLPFVVRQGTTAKLFIQDGLNVSFLLAHDIRNGVMFRLDGPVSLDKMKLFTTQLRQFAKSVYVEHLKPVNMVCTLTVSEQEVI